MKIKPITLPEMKEHIAAYDTELQNALINGDLPAMRRLERLAFTVTFNGVEVSVPITGDTFAILESLVKDLIEVG
jgi:hypothetical protein